MPVEHIVIEALDSDSATAFELHGKESTCIVPISIGQLYHEGEDWAETVSLINSKFERCVIVVADTLQCYTEMMKDGALDESKPADIAIARARAQEAGQAWLERTQVLTARITIPYTITRWDQWITHPGYSNKKTLIDASYKERKKGGFRSSVDKVIRKFINGFQRAEDKREGDEDLIDFDINRAVTLCRDYLLEEMAVFTMWRDNIAPELLQTKSNHYFTAYNFGNSSTNKEIRNCLSQLSTTGNMHSLNLQKKDLTHKKSKQKQPIKAKFIQPQINSIVSAVETTKSPIMSAQEKAQCDMFEQVLRGSLQLTISLPQFTVTQRIALLHGVELYAQDMSAKLSAKLSPEDNTHTQKEHATISSSIDNGSTTILTPIAKPSTISSPTTLIISQDGDRKPLPNRTSSTDLNEFEENDVTSSPRSSLNIHASHFQKNITQHPTSTALVATTLLQNLSPTH